MDERVNRALIEKWQNADALYATPTGSNDDWLVRQYWHKLCLHSLYIILH